MKKEKLDIETIRHSLAHVLAAAVTEMFPEAHLGIGPAIDNGFYYDFDLPRTLIPEDLPLIEEKMKKIISADLSFEKVEISTQGAIKKLKDSKEIFKSELVRDLEEEGMNKVSLYKTGKFIDLCRGPHVKSTKDLKNIAFRLDKIAGAYWKGDEKNKMLQRIYGLAFEDKTELDQYLKIRAEAAKRDHKKLGRELELFFFDESAPGMAYWLPKGLKIYNLLLDFWRREHEKEGYQEIRTPLLNKKELFVKSGHWDHYREQMYISQTQEDEIYALKPMNCPNAIVVYRLRPRSYRELPLRLSDCDILHRSELSGTLNGLLRIRSFSQDDAHIFLREEQIEKECQKIFAIVEKFYSVFGLDYSFRLSTRPEKFMGEIKIWDHAEDVLKKVLEKSGKKFVVEEGEGAFYGPKIDILMKDSLQREWQTGTVQLDFQLPKNFGLKYIDEKGKEKEPVIIHRVIYGSLERFIGILIEHCAGAFPVWLAPVQVVVLPVSDKINDYADKVFNQLKEAGVRAEIDLRPESISKKIREAELQKIPYMLVVGEKEERVEKIAVRIYGKGDQGQKELKEVIKKIKS